MHVETIAARSALHAWRIAPHRHRDLQQLLYLRRGSVEVSIDAATQSLRGPAVIVVPAGCVHGFHFEAQTRGFVISFAAGLAAELAAAAPELMDFLNQPAARALDRAALRATDVERLADMLLREFERSAAGRDTALHGLLATLLANLLRLAQSAPEQRMGMGNRDQELLARYRQSIERNFRGHTGIATHARALGTSEARLRRACIAAAGESPLELLHARLFVEAVRQLSYTSMTVSEVAYYLGYEDPAYFSRFFTRRAGKSPTAFRQHYTSR